jgi:hypothetical protein
VKSVHANHRTSLDGLPGLSAEATDGIVIRRGVS